MKMVISVGSNLEDPTVQVQRALERLGDEFTVLATSSIYRTSPVGVEGQPEYRNAVVIIDDKRTPADVLRVLQQIEGEAGRVRSEKWAARTLDLDLIVADEIVSDDPFCTLPHPRAHERAFVLIPWAEIDAEASIPGRGPIRELAATSVGEVHL